MVESYSQTRSWSSHDGEILRSWSSHDGEILRSTPLLLFDPCCVLSIVVCSYNRLFVSLIYCHADLPYQLGPSLILCPSGGSAIFINFPAGNISTWLTHCIRLLTETPVMQRCSLMSVFRSIVFLLSAFFHLFSCEPSYSHKRSAPVVVALSVPMYPINVDMPMWHMLSTCSC